MKTFIIVILLVIVGLLGVYFVGKNTIQNEKAEALSIDTLPKLCEFLASRTYMISTSRLNGKSKQQIKDKITWEYLFTVVDSPKRDMSLFILNDVFSKTRAQIQTTVDNMTGNEKVAIEVCINSRTK